MKIGTMEIIPILDGHGRTTASDLVQRSDGFVDWDCPNHPMGADGKLQLSFGGFLIQVAGRNILIDAGVGTLQTDQWSGGRFPQSLRDAGVAPDEVTDVVFTHLHFDHVGWATQKGAPFFDNATYRMHADDWAYFVDGPEANPGAIRKLDGIRERIETFDSEHTLAPGLDARPAPGHTPGSTVFIISSGAERALLLGDVAHSVIELEDPEWQGLHDLDSVAARQVRDALVNEAELRGDAIAAAHFPDLQFGRLLTVSGRRSFGYL